MTARWNYTGDINLENGGLFWCEDGYADYVLAVRVTPVSDAGGPDNVFLVESGSIYLPEDKAPAALETCGYSLRNREIVDCTGAAFPLASGAGRLLMVDAFCAYHGLDVDSSELLQLGRRDEFCRSGGWDPNPDRILRGNTSLLRYVRREFLGYAA